MMPLYIPTGPHEYGDPTLSTQRRHDTQVQLWRSGARKPLWDRDMVDCQTVVPFKVPIILRAQKFKASDPLPFAELSLC